MDIVGILFIILLGGGLILSGFNILALSYGFGSTQKVDYIAGYGVLLSGIAIEYVIFTKYIDISIGG